MSAKILPLPAPKTKNAPTFLGVIDALVRMGTNKIQVQQVAIESAIESANLRISLLRCVSIYRTAIIFIISRIFV